MSAQNRRRCDRISMELPIQVSGMDPVGHAFLEDTHTQVLSRHGAKILLKHKLVPHQEINVHCLQTHQEVDARIVGQIGQGPGGYCYGIELLDPTVNIWGIEFPPLAESEKAVARVLLECVGCHTRELTYLNEFEVEVFEASHFLSRKCSLCTDTSIWKKSTGQAEADQTASPVPAAVAPSPPPAATPPRTQNERKEFRLGIKMTACIRDAQLGEEVLVTENASRSGFAFKSRKHYDKDSLVQVAVPYSTGAGNIFTPGRIEYAEELPAEGLTRYGVSYVRAHEWSEKDH